jgi:hypothetical protein
LRNWIEIAFVTLGALLVCAVAILVVRSVVHPTAGLGSGARIEAGATSRCHERSGLQDATCTPGATFADVTQATIGATICRSGYTARGVRSDGRPVRPPASFTDPLKVSGIAAYGYTDVSATDYEEDHLIPLEIGGDGWSPANLWPEPRYGLHNATDKDKVENQLHQLICSRRVSLDAAQKAIARNWETALSVVQ